MLGILSYFVFGYFRWTVYPFTALLFAGLTNALTLYSMPESTYLIGASGMVYWLAGFWLTLFIFIERQHSLTQRIVRSLGVALMTLFPSTLEAQVSYKAHGIGFLLGLLFAIAYFTIHKASLRSSEEWKIIFDEEDLEGSSDPTGLL
jgi:rhomboid protease GluP